MQLDKLKDRIPEIVDNSQDKLLEQLLEDAKAEILDYTNREVLLSSMESLQRELSLIYYNRLGGEGISSQSQGGISTTYGTDIPENIKSRLKSYRRLRVSNYANKES